MRARNLCPWLLAATLVAAIFAVGGAPRWAVLLTASLATASLAATFGSRGKLVRLGPLIATLAVLVGLTALQLVPLPPAAMRALHPIAADLLADHVGLLDGGGPIWAPLSLDPPTTRLELLELAALLGVAVVATRVAARGRGADWLLQLVAWSTAAAGVIALGHRLVGAESLYGLYLPSQARERMVAPLLNMNHFACLMALGALTGLGLALDARRSAPARVGHALGAVACLVAGLIAGSRGGAIALTLGLVALGGLLAAQRLTRRAPSTAPRAPWLVTVPAAVLVLCGLVLVIVASSTGVVAQLRATGSAELDDPRSKYVAWRSAASLIEASPWLGVGRGGFEPAFTRVHPASAYQTVSYLENEYLQVVVDWGLVGALLAAIGLGWTAARIGRAWNGGAPAAGAIAGLVAVAAQSVVDFGLELLGLAVPVAIVIAALVPGALRERPRGAPWLRCAALAGLVGCLAIGASPLGRSLPVDHRALAELPGDALDEVRAIARRHRFDYVALGRVAQALVARRDPAAPACLNLALRLHPDHPALHRIAARLLAQSGRAGQARVEYRLAIAATPDPAELVREVLARQPAVDAALEALPVDHPRPERLVRILIDLGRDDLALAFLRRAVEAPGARPVVLELLAEQAERAGDLPSAELALRRWAAASGSPAIRARLAGVLVDAGRLDEAESLLARLIDEVGASSDVVRASFALADARIAATAWPQARRALDPLRTSTRLRLDEQRGLHARLARVEEAVGDPGGAERERVELHRLEDR